MSESADSDLVFGAREYFPGIGRIAFEGLDSDNPMAFKYYDPERVVAGKTMRDHLRFAVCFWHSFCGMGGDPFGPGTRRVSWMRAEADAMELARARLDAAFEFFAKLGVDFYCFHDRDLAPEGRALSKSRVFFNARPNRITGIKHKPTSCTRLSLSAPGRKPAGRR